MATITITVTVSNPGSGNKYYLDGVLQATYVATPGNTYKFDQSDNSNDGHPLRLSITSDGTHNSGSAYTTGVTTSGTPGNAGAYTQIEVTALTVQALYYYCTAHSGMGGSFNTGSSATVQYQERAGFAVQNRTTDPVPYAQALADNPYAGSWASGGSMNTARYEIVGLGIQTAALAVGGTENPGTRTTLNEEYNGTAWTEKADLNTGRTAMGASERGTITSSLVFGGATSGGESALSESWNGSAWTETNDLNTAAYRCAGAGTLTAALRIGGNIPPATANTETFNGTSWTEVNDLNQARQFLAGGGTQTSAVVAGGTNPGGSIYGNSETWNGSSWTETSDLTTARYAAGGNAASSTDGLIYGGQLPPAGPPIWQKQTEAWNGSAWTEVADLSGVRGTAGGAGASGTSALTMGGQNPGPALTTSEEWAFSGLPPATPAANYSESIVGDIYYNSGTGEFKAIKDGGAPAGSWSSGGSLNTARYDVTGAGSQTAALATGGYVSGPGSALTELYNGTAWTEVNDLNTGRYGQTSTGTQTAALASGASHPSGSQAYVESWDGTSWTEKADLNTARGMSGSAGAANTANIVFAGQAPQRALTELWNGSSWTEVGDLSIARHVVYGTGSSTAALCSGGNLPPSPYTADTEIWDGTSWTEVADMNAIRGRGGTAGISTLALVFGGTNGPSALATTEAWDGTSWTEVSDLATARYGGAGNPGTSSSTSSTLYAGGSAPGPMTAITEEWTAADFQIKTLTTS